MLPIVQLWAGPFQDQPPEITAAQAVHLHDGRYMALSCMALALLLTLLLWTRCARYAENENTSSVPHTLC